MIFFQFLVMKALDPDCGSWSATLLRTVRMDLIEPVLPELPDRGFTDQTFAGWKRQLESTLAQQERLAVFLPGGEYSRHQCVLRIHAIVVWIRIRGSIGTSVSWMRIRILLFSASRYSRQQCALRIHEIVVWIRIRGSIPVTNGSGSCCFHQWPSRRQLKIIIFS